MNLWERTAEIIISWIRKSVYRWEEIWDIPQSLKNCCYKKTRDTYVNGDDVTRGVYSRNTGLYQVLSQVTDVALMFFTQMLAFFTAQNLKIQSTSHEQIEQCYFTHHTMVNIPFWELKRIIFFILNSTFVLLSLKGINSQKMITVDS